MADAIKEFMKIWAMKWVFQLEKGEHGWQWGMSLKKKRRLQELIRVADALLDKVDFSATSKESCGDFGYCDKVDTRIDGP